MKKITKANERKIVFTIIFLLSWWLHTLVLPNRPVWANGLIAFLVLATPNMFVYFLKKKENNVKTEQQ